MSRAYADLPHIREEHNGKQVPFTSVVLLMTHEIAAAASVLASLIFR